MNEKYRQKLMDDGYGFILTVALCPIIVSQDCNWNRASNYSKMNKLQKSYTFTLTIKTYSQCIVILPFSNGMFKYESRNHDHSIIK